MVNFKARLQKVFTVLPEAARLPRRFGRVAELADAKDLGSFGAILAGSTPVAPTIFHRASSAPLCAPATGVLLGPPSEILCRPGYARAGYGGLHARLEPSDIYRAPSSRGGLTEDLDQARSFRFKLDVGHNERHRWDYVALRIFVLCQMKLRIPARTA